MHSSFMLETSLLDSFDVALCRSRKKVITEDNASEEQIEYVKDRNSSDGTNTESKL